MDKPSIKTDVYDWAISAFEVLSKFSSQCEYSLANLMDRLLLQAIGRGKRSNINDIMDFYPESDE